MKSRPEMRFAFQQAFAGQRFDLIVGVEQQEDVTMYNFLAGLQGGARVRMKAGDYVVSPWIMADMMGGTVSNTKAMSCTVIWTPEGSRYFTSSPPVCNSGIVPLI